MKYLSSFVGTALFVLLAAVAGQVRADYLNWTYTSTLSVPGISVNAGANGGASVALTGFTSHAGGASIPVIAAVTSTDSSAGINFNNLSYNLALTITDGNKDSGTLNFTGYLNGSLTKSTSSLVASFAPVTSNSLTFDGHTYSVSISSLTLPAPTSSQQDIMANVTVTTPSGSPPQHSNGTPEPTGLLLGSMGFTCFGLRCWWKRRRLTC